MIFRKSRGIMSGEPACRRGVCRASPVFRPLFLSVYRRKGRESRMAAAGGMPEDTVPGENGQERRIQNDKNKCNEASGCSQNSL